MKYKIYTSQHQMLYSEIFSLPANKKNELIINKEASYLANKYKEIREDFIVIGKSKKIDALFSDVFIGKKDKVYIYEHIILRGDTVFILERDNGYGNQEKLLKEKSNYLKKVWGDTVNVSCHIISAEKEDKTIKNTLENILAIIDSHVGVDKYSDGIKDYIVKKHLNLNIKTYFKLKYDLNVDEIKVKRKSGPIKVPKKIIPNLLKNNILFKNSVRISFLSSCTMLLYGLCALFSTYSVLKITNFSFAIVLDFFYGWFLYKILSFIEVYVPKRYKYFLLFLILLIFGVFLYKILYLI